MILKNFAKLVRRFSSMRRTFSKLELQSQFAVTSTDSSLISRNFSKLVVSYQRTTIYSWETTSTEATTLLRLWPFLFASSADTQTESQFLEETTNQSRSHKFTGSMMSAWENTEMPMFGNTSLLSSIIFHLLPLSKATSSASMEVFLHPSIPLIKLTNLIESWKCQLRDQSAIFCGQTQMTDVVGVSHLEVLVIPLDKISVNSSTTRMIWNWSQELTNLSWMDTIGRMIVT